MVTLWVMREQLKVLVILLDKPSDFSRSTVAQSVLVRFRTAVRLVRATRENKYQTGILGKVKLKLILIFSPRENKNFLMQLNRPLLRFIQVRCLLVTDCTFSEYLCILTFLLNLTVITGIMAILKLLCILA